MPKTPIDYSKAVIYSIVCKTDETLLYIGSTTEYTKRKYSHKTACNCENSEKHNRPVYVMMRANGGWDNFDMKPVKEFPCENKIQLIIEEERIRVEMKANLNTYRAYLSPAERMEQQHENSKQYKEANAETIAEYKKKYAKDNAAKIAEDYKKYYEANAAKLCEKGKKYYEANTAKIAETGKKYREANTAKIAEDKKKYREANAAKLCENGKKYREANTTKIAEAKKHYYEKNKEQILERNRIKYHERKNAL